MKNEVCNFCSGEHYNDLNNTVEYSGIEICLDGKRGDLRVRIFPEGCETWENIDIVNVKYCPMCGRRLRLR